MTPDYIEALGMNFETGFYVIGVVMLVIKILKSLMEKTFSWRGMLDVLTNISTQIPSVLVETFIMAFAYAGFVYLADTYISWTLPINIWTVGLTVLVCDFVYYWEHRIAHEVRLLWTQHAVHHSSRFMNTSVAIRFGPFEGVVSALFHLPLIFLGFPPTLVFFGIVFVLAYQVWIHTEMIDKLGVLDEVLNTPANHRVHHGCDDKYIDKNYGGILIIWDRMFGTFQREEERPRYGLKRDFESINPFIVCISELPGFFRDLSKSKSFREFWMYMFGPPHWTPESRVQGR